MDPVLFEQTLAHIHDGLSQKVWYLLTRQADLEAILHTAKDMFLLGKGDFFVAFLEEATDTLLGAITSTSPSEIETSFDNAFAEVNLSRSSLPSSFLIRIIQDESDTTAVVDAAALSMINIPKPLQVLFTKDVLQRYNKIFRFLLKLRVTQHALDLCWKIQMKQRRAHKWKQQFASMWIVRSHMAHIIGSLQSYIHSDVLESSFQELLSHVRSKLSLSSMLQHHSDFLENISRRTFQTTNKVNKEIDTLLCVCLDLYRLVSRYASPTLIPMEAVATISERLTKIVSFLLPVLTSVSDRHLAQLLLRVDFNQSQETSRGDITQSFPLSYRYP
eukprot:gene9119-1420_t